MAEPRHLTRAPITEGLIDFRVEAPAGVNVDRLVAAIAARGNFGYMAKGPIVRSEFGFSLGAQQAHVRSTSIGVRLHSPDERYVALLGIEGFTFSRLEPYQSWEDLLREARPLWDDDLDVGDNVDPGGRLCLVRRDLLRHSESRATSPQPAGA